MTNSTLEAPATRPSMACSTVSIVLVFVMTTETLRASVTRKAGPAKSITPLMKGFGDGLLAETADDPDHNRHHEKQRGEFRQPPPELPPERRVDRLVRVRVDGGVVEDARPRERLRKRAARR